MTPVATYRGKALALKGAGLVLLGLAFLGAAAVVPVYLAEETARGRASWWLLLMMAMPLALGWGTLAGGVRRCRAAFEKDCFLRAGPEGLAVRVPGGARRSAAWLAYDLWDYSFAWDEVESLSWSLDGGDKTLVIRAGGGSLELEGSFFREPVKAILENMRRAAHPRALPIPKTTL